MYNWPIEVLVYGIGKDISGLLGSNSYIMT